jgi:hypothetical protein
MLCKEPRKRQCIYIEFQAVTVLGLFKAWVHESWVTMATKFGMFVPNSFGPPGQNFVSPLYGLNFEVTARFLENLFTAGLR